MKALIQKLKQIKDYCSKHEICDNCIYQEDKCVVIAYVRSITELPPSDWVVEKLEKMKWQ